MIASIGDLALLIHDWVFLEQYLAASLTMPIAVRIFRGDVATDVASEMKRVAKIRLLSNLAFYMVLLAWFLASTITQMFFWRMSISIIIILSTLVFLVGFFRIRSMIRQ